MPSKVQSSREKPRHWLMLLGLCGGSVLVQLPPARCEENPVALRTFSEARTLGRARSTFQERHAPTIADLPEPHLDEYAKSIQPILEQACVQCHGAQAQEGNVRIDTLDPDLVHGDDIDWWLEVQSVLSNSEMPPPDEIQLADADRAQIIKWLSNEIQVASISRRESKEHSSFRRMTRYEFNYALQDLLGLPYDFAKELPPEANSPDGFQNSSDLLHMSVSQLEAYRRLVRKALMRATARGDRPAVLHWGVTMQDSGRIDWAKQNAQVEKAKAETVDDPKQQTQRLAELEKQFRQPRSVPHYKNKSTGRTVPASWAYQGA